MTKVAFACRDLEALQRRVASRAVGTELRVATRMRPKRSSELIGAGVALVFGVIHPEPDGLLLGAVIGASMIINNLAAGLGGILVPVTLDRLRIDPAVSSAVFVTTITDVTGFFSFLGLAALAGLGR